MSFNFEVLLNQGKEAANDVLKNREEVRAVLEDLKRSLSSFLELDISLQERIEFESDNSIGSILGAGLFKPKVKTGFNRVYIKSKEVDVERILFKIKRDDDVYPVTVVEGKNHYVSDNQSEFVDAIGEVVRNSQVHIMLKAFVNTIEAEKARPVETE